MEEEGTFQGMLLEFQAEEPLEPWLRLDSEVWKEG